MVLRILTPLRKLKVLKTCLLSLQGKIQAMHYLKFRILNSIKFTHLDSE